MFHDRRDGMQVARVVDRPGVIALCMYIHSTEYLL